MTVIAYDGKYLVADGRSTRGTTLVSNEVQKLHQLEMPTFGKCIVGVCGALPVLGPWLTHLAEKSFTEPFEGFVGKDEDGPLEMMGLVLTEDKQAFEIFSDGGWFPINTPTAVGSGSYTAQHFLTTGHDAVQAVKEACKTELTCGGDITVYDITTGKFDTIKG
jgi:20S proteasome alpha/beta subunit